jgi:hypothetical protein
LALIAPTVRRSRLRLCQHLAALPAPGAIHRAALRTIVPALRALLNVTARLLLIDLTLIGLPWHFDGTRHFDALHRLRHLLLGLTGRHPLSLHAHALDPVVALGPFLRAGDARHGGHRQNCGKHRGNATGYQ